MTGLAIARPYIRDDNTDSKRPSVRRRPVRPVVSERERDKSQSVW